MKLSLKRYWPAICLMAFFLGTECAHSQEALPKETSNKDLALLQVMHSISSNCIMEWIEYLCSERFGGRLGGSEGYRLAAEWLADRLLAWKLEPAGEQGTYFQFVPDPYTEVLPGNQLVMQIPVKGGAEIKKLYRLEEDFFPGATSAAGEVSADVVYVGYGVTAPELQYDDYRGQNVKGKIVMLEPEIPVSSSQDVDLFRCWRPYSFHQYKVKNARDHGASGMLYHYHIVNPNCTYLDGFLLTYIGDTIVDDIFAGTGRCHADIVAAIAKLRRPQSFATGKRFYIKNITRHHAEGRAANVLARISGTGPAEQKRVLLLGAHLDHVGRNPELMPGANDDASGVAVLLAVAKALAAARERPFHDVFFLFFTGEEQGVLGSEFYLQHLQLAKEKVIGFINLDGVGLGDRISALAADDFPALWEHFSSANQQYVHRVLAAEHFANLGRPRLDAARFLWAGIPAISFSVYSENPLPFSIYHNSQDKPEHLDAEVMEDLARIIFLAVSRSAGQI